MQLLKPKAKLRKIIGKASDSLLILFDFGIEAITEIKKKHIKWRLLYKSYYCTL
jgi:hypothetical protein